MTRNSTESFLKRVFRPSAVAREKAALGDTLDVARLLRRSLLFPSAKRKILRLSLTVKLKERQEELASLKGQKPDDERLIDRVSGTIIIASRATNAYRELIIGSLEEEIKRLQREIGEK